MKEKIYDRQKSIEYAKKWAYGRNPKYYNFDPVGGDCTSFISQCIYAGSGIMNYNRYGWFYKNGNNKSPSWSGVEYLYKFLTQNKGVGPYGEEVGVQSIQKGDVIQLRFDGNVFGHSLLVIEKNIINIRSMYEMNLKSDIKTKLQNGCWFNRHQP